METKKFELKPNSGSLFKNMDKDGDSAPDYRGSANVDGCEYWVSGWINTAQKSGQKYLKLSFRPKNSEAAEAAASAEKGTAAEEVPFDDAIPF